MCKKSAKQIQKEMHVKAHGSVLLYVYFSVKRHSPWLRFRTSPESQSLCRNCPLRLCCWSSLSSGHIYWRAELRGWGFHQPASPCCPGHASTWTRLQTWSLLSHRTPRTPPLPLCSTLVSCSQIVPDLEGGKRIQWNICIFTDTSQMSNRLCG